MSAGNVILGKPDFHYLIFLLASLQVIPLGSPTCSSRPRAAYTLDDLHSSTLAIAWGDITILMLHSTPGANECHKKISLDSIFLKTPPFSLFSLLPTRLFLLFPPALSHLLSLFWVFFSSTPPIPSHSLV